jgi:uncharacterized Zn finger protein (UPF0148 family)
MEVRCTSCGYINTIEDPPAEEKPNTPAAPIAESTGETPKTMDAAAGETTQESAGRTVQSSDNTAGAETTGGAA